MNYAKANRLRLARQRMEGPRFVSTAPRRPWALSFVCPTCGQHRGARIHRRHMRAAAQ
jgi:hypothetical protein